jgi:thioredoxin 1
MKEVTDQNFEEIVLKSDKLTLVDFWAIWCGPCRMLSPILEEISNEYKDKIEVVKCDVDKNPELAVLYKIRNIPAILIFKDGENTDKLIGLTSKETYIKKINDLLK